MLLAVLPETGSSPRRLSVRVLQRVALSNQLDLGTGSSASHQGVIDHQLAAGCQQHPVLKVEEECWSGMVERPCRVADRLRYLEVGVLRLVTRVAWTGG